MVKKENLPIPGLPSRVLSNLLSGRSSDLAVSVARKLTIDAACVWDLPWAQKGNCKMRGAGQTEVSGCVGTTQLPGPWQKMNEEDRVQGGGRADRARSCKAWSHPKESASYPKCCGRVPKAWNWVWEVKIYVGHGGGTQEAGRAREEIAQHSTGSDTRLWAWAGRWPPRTEHTGPDLRTERTRT